MQLGIVWLFQAASSSDAIRWVADPVVIIRLVEKGLVSGINIVAMAMPPERIVETMKRVLSERDGVKISESSPAVGGIV